MERGELYAEERRTAAYWYATGRGVDHDNAVSFGLVHWGEAMDYARGDVGILPGVITSFEAWSNR